MKVTINNSEFETFQLGYDPIPDWFMNRVTNNTIVLHAVNNDPDLHMECRELSHCIIDGKYGEKIRGNKGDFIVLTKDGQMLPCHSSLYTILINKQT